MVSCQASTVLYSAGAGLWGVVVTDLAQFALALGGTVAFAVVAVDQAGGLSELLARVRAADLDGNTLRLIPSFAPSADPALLSSLPGSSEPT